MTWYNKERRDGRLLISVLPTYLPQRIIKLVDTEFILYFAAYNIQTQLAREPYFKLKIMEIDKIKQNKSCLIRLIF